MKMAAHFGVAIELMLSFEPFESAASALKHVGEGE